MDDIFKTDSSELKLFCCSASLSNADAFKVISLFSFVVCENYKCSKTLLMVLSRFVSFLQRVSVSCIINSLYSGVFLSLFNSYLFGRIGRDDVQWVFLHCNNLLESVWTQHHQDQLNIFVLLAHQPTPSILHLQDLLYTCLYLWPAQFILFPCLQMIINLQCLQCRIWILD